MIFQYFLDYAGFQFAVLFNLFFFIFLSFSISKIYNSVTLNLF